MDYIWKYILRAEFWVRLIHLILSQILFSLVGIWASFSVFKHSLAFVWFISSIPQWNAWVEILKTALELYWWSFSLQVSVLQAPALSADMLWRAVSDLATYGSRSEVLCLWIVLVLFTISFLKINGYPKFFGFVCRVPALSCFLDIHPLVILFLWPCRRTAPMAVSRKQWTGFGFANLGSLAPCVCSCELRLCTLAAAWLVQGGG